MSLFARHSVYKIGRVTSLVAGLVCCFSSLVRAQEAAPAPPPEGAPPAAPAAAPAISPELAQRLDELDQRTRITERKLEIAQEVAAEKAATASTVTTGERGFAIGNADGSYQLKIQGLLQIDGRRVFQSDDAVLRDRIDTFYVRRARPIIETTILGLVDARIMPDFGNNTVALLDAYVDIHPAAWLRLRSGKFKPPIGLERLQTDAYVPLPERALDSALSSQRDVGVELWGDIANAAVHYELAIFNGNPDGTLIDVDNEHAKSYAGRLFLRPFQLGGLKWLGDLGVGFAAMSGNEKGSGALTNGVAANTWLPTFKTAGQSTIYTFVSSGTDPALTVYAARRHTRINPQLYYYVGSFGLLAEYIHEYQQVAKGATAGAVNNQAGHITLSWAFGGLNSFDGVKPVHVANWATKDVGAIEVVVRFSELDLDDLGFQGSAFADPSKSVTLAKEGDLGVNWWLNRNIKISGAWQQTWFTGGAGTTATVTDRATEKVGLARVQVAF